VSRVLRAARSTCPAKYVETCRAAYCFKGIRVRGTYGRRQRRRTVAADNRRRLVVQNCVRKQDWIIVDRSVVSYSAKRSICDDAGRGAWRIYASAHETSTSFAIAELTIEQRSVVLVVMVSAAPLISLESEAAVRLARQPPRNFRAKQACRNIREPSGPATMDSCQNRYYRRCESCFSRSSYLPNSLPKTLSVHAGTERASFVTCPSTN